MQRRTRRLMRCVPAVGLETGSTRGDDDYAAANATLQTDARVAASVDAMRRGVAVQRRTRRLMRCVPRLGWRLARPEATMTTLRRMRRCRLTRVSQRLLMPCGEESLVQRRTRRLMRCVLRLGWRLARPEATMTTLRRMRRCRLTRVSQRLLMPCGEESLVQRRTRRLMCSRAFR